MFDFNNFFFDYTEFSFLLQFVKIHAEHYVTTQGSR